MKTHRLSREELGPAAIAGRVLARDMRGADGAIALRKGAILEPGDEAVLRDLVWPELHLIEMEAGELHEEAAGRRIARAAAGEGVVIQGLSGGAWPLRAKVRGLLEIDVDGLRAINRVDGISLSTLLDGQIVEEGETVARAKIIPLVIAEAGIAEAEAAVRGRGGVVRVRAFRPARVAAVVQDTLTPTQKERFREAVGGKIAWFGSTLLEPAYAEATEAGLAAALEDAVEQGAEIVLLAGSKAMDPLDPAFAALTRLGGSLERHGAAAHPGSLFWMAGLRGTPVLGMPNCSLFSKATVLDLVLPRILAGERMDAAAMAELGHGGLLTRELSFRLPSYDPGGDRGAIGEPK